MDEHTFDAFCLAPGDRGEAVKDLQRRLAAAGFDQPATDGDDYGHCTVEAVRGFQVARLLPASGVCDKATWAALVEAGYRLGDRLLYLRRPMLRGDDVAELQLRLSALGFDSGRVDGILGPETERALKDFQRNCALTTDGVAGPDVLAALARLGARSNHSTAIAGVRERERLTSTRRALKDRRVVIGESGGLDALARSVVRTLHDSGAQAVLVQHPDESIQAEEANRFDADAFIGLEVLVDGPCRLSYYATAGFESIGGRHLAGLIGACLHDVAGVTSEPAKGLRLPVLRETRMPAVYCELGPAEVVVERTAELARSLASGLERWALAPVES